MGNYFNPTEKLPEIGRRLNEADYDGLIAQLKPGEKLLGLYDNLIWMAAPHLFSA